MMRKKRPLILASLLALICVSAPAQEETTTGTISGRAVNERGEPVAGALVMARAVGTFSGGRTTTADGEGNFRFTGMEPTLYNIYGNAPSYIFQLPEPDVPGTYYRVGDSVRLEFVKGGVITGTVTNAAGEPIVGIRVRALRIRDPKGKPARMPQFGQTERSTDDRGIYRIYGLSPGLYLVNAGGSGNQSYMFNPFDADVPTYSPSSNRDTAAEFNVRSGEEVTADIRYRNDPGRTVSGTVKSMGTQGTSITLVSTDGSLVPGVNGHQAPGARGFAITGVGDGEYNVYAMEAVSPLSAESNMPDMAISEAKRITVKGADVTGIELVTRPLGAINGSISLEPSKAPECQGKRKPLFSEMLVEFQRHEKDSEPMAAFVRAFASGVSVNPKGAFSVRNIMPGRYRFNARFFARYWYLQSISTGATATPATARTAAQKNDAAATWTAVKPSEQLSSLTITLAEGAASIRGKLTVAEGGSIPTGAAVYLVPAEPDKASDVLRYFVTEVTADGAFSFNNLPPGRYWTLLQNPVQTETDTLLKLRLPESAEARTKLRRAAETQKSNVELKPCQTLADYQLPFK